MSSKTATPAKVEDPRKHVRADETKPMTQAEIQAMYTWSGDEEDCPENLFINASNAPIILGAQAQIPGDSGRIYPGDRVMGEYYASILELPMFTGLQRLKAVPTKRRMELERQRLRRSGDLPPEWMLKAWEALEPQERKKHEAEYGLLIERARKAKEGD